MPCQSVKRSGLAKRSSTARRRCCQGPFHLASTRLNKRNVFSRKTGSKFGESLPLISRPLILRLHTKISTVNKFTFHRHVAQIALIPCSLDMIFEQYSNLSSAWVKLFLQGGCVFSKETSELMHALHGSI